MFCTLKPALESSPKKLTLLQKGSPSFMGLLSTDVPGAAQHWASSALPAIQDQSAPFSFSLCDWLLSPTGSESCLLLLHPQRGLSPETAKCGSLACVHQAGCKCLNNSTLAAPGMEVGAGCPSFSALGNLSHNRIVTGTFRLLPSQDKQKAQV